MRTVSTLRGRPPLVGAATWTAVLDAAEDQCQCIGHCGKPHKQEAGRCDRTHTNQHRLIVAAADPLTPLPAATRLPVEQLRVWCPTCLTAATRVARQDAARDAVAVPQPALFDLPA